MTDYFVISWHELASLEVRKKIVECLDMHLQMAPTLHSQSLLGTAFRIRETQTAIALN